MIIVLLILLAAVGCTSAPEQTSDSPTLHKTMDSDTLQLATFGAGCFWCTEAIFSRLDGVVSVTPGYSGGTTPNPTYEQVCTGTTGHAEVCRIAFDPHRISYDKLLEVFWKTHDPTTPNRQGNDVGTQYRSVIFYHDDHQRERAEYYKRILNESGIFGAQIVTEIVPAAAFYQAEEYHHDYFKRNPEKAYCALVIRPKVEKFEQLFRDKVRQR
ncbi:MAG: peptide-methionine (S)-S-oxide reductase MsrA [Chlorobi bacterium]|nr:peptide-methionine (S)-S-oxide reductase MsrA [Chlorobiota bacterium]